MPSAQLDLRVPLQPELLVSISGFPQSEQGELDKRHLGICVLAIAFIKELIYGCVGRRRGGGLCFLLPVPQQARL